MKNYKIFWLSLALFVFAIDQYSKFLVSFYLIPEHFVSVFPGFSLFFTYNTGAAFSFLAQAGGWQEWLFSGLAVAVSLAIVYWLIFSAPKGGRIWIKCAFMLILGGALGNLLDRVMFGHVRDFLYFYWRDFSWPTFNLADSAISVGVIILILEIFFGQSNISSTKNKKIGKPSREER